MKWENLREEEFKGAIEKSGGLCVVPLGCIEVHGEHMPVGTDYFRAQAFIDAAAELEDVVIFPTGFWLGDVGGAHATKDPWNHHLSGQIGISSKLQMLALTEICGEIARNGFRKILIVSNHGGNQAYLNYFVRSYAYERRDHAVMWTGGYDSASATPDNLYPIIKANPEKFPYITAEDMEVLARFAEGKAGGGHASLNEASVVMYAQPGLVRLDRCQVTSGESTHRADYLNEAGVKADFTWPSNYPNMYQGWDPIGSSATIGRAMVQVSAERLARIFKMLKEDEDSVRMAKGLPKEE